jgi:DNA-binding NarL/FixJ family response regulator
MSVDELAVRVLIVADDPLARAGLATLLADAAACGIVGQVPADSSLAVALEVYRPDVVVWDLGWDPEPSLDRLIELTEQQSPIVVLLPDEASAADAWAAGARGLLLRDVAADALAATLRAVAQGLSVFDPELADASQAFGDLTLEGLAEELTPRELEVVQLLATGLSNKAIAYQLGISEHTVKFHINAIMNKLGAQSRTEAAVRATRMGLILL